MPHLILRCSSPQTRAGWKHDQRDIQLIPRRENGETLFVKLKKSGSETQISLLTTPLDLILNRHKRTLQNFARTLRGPIIKTNLGRFLKDEKGLAYLWNEEQLASLNWHDPRPRILEIGSGNGSFLHALAGQSPKSLYVGTEINGFILKKALRAAENLPLNNVIYLKKDATYLLDLLIPEGSLDTIHIHFPDPWLKKRHHKRRLINPRTLPAFGKALKTGGTLHFTTDDPTYATEVQKLLRASPFFSLKECGTTVAPRIRTKYERKWLAEGRAIHTFIFQRTSRPLLTPLSEQLIRDFAVPARIRPRSGMVLREGPFTLVFQDVYRGSGNDIIDAVVSHRSHTWFVLFTWESGVLRFSREHNHRFLTSGVKRHIETLLQA